MLRRAILAALLSASIIVTAGCKVDVDDDKTKINPPEITINQDK